MTILAQQSIVSSVRREGEWLRAEASALGRGAERGARLLLGAADFCIRDAFFEAGRVPEGDFCGSGRAEALSGAPATFDGSGFFDALRTLQGPAAAPEFRALFIECVKALTQAETFVIDLRGFESEAAYEDYWWNRERGGCLYYANEAGPAGVGNGWFDHVGSRRREEFLFSRTKTCLVRSDGGQAEALGVLLDSYHEMDCRVSFDRSTGRIHQAELTAFRVPDPVCKGFEALGPALAGRDAYGLSRRDLAGILGGPGGCFHLTDLAADLFALIRSCSKED